MGMARWGLRVALAIMVSAPAIVAQSSTTRAPTPRQSASPIGVWRGTSTCRVQPSACHDEIVVYRITQAAARDSATMDARKIVNGQEEEMGILACGLAAHGWSLTCTMRNGAWHFAVRGDSLVGELRLPDSTRFRDVRAIRAR
jgi:hypothetical protein